MTIWLISTDSSRSVRVSLVFFEHTMNIPQASASQKPDTQLNPSANPARNDNAEEVSVLGRFAKQ
jgi:hypothetical protein